MKHRDDFIKAVHREIELQKNYLDGDPVHTIYFGGGTPSLLSEKELGEIFNQLYHHFNIDVAAEITLEANPDDLDIHKIKQLAGSPVNRLSIGIQSFHDEDLYYLNRVHSADDARRCIELSHDHGFENLTIDLIFGIPTLSDERWMQNLETFAAYELPHLSAYALTVEPNTAMEVLIRKKKMKPVDDEHTIHHFYMLMDFAEQHGYRQYEISNYCREPHYSKHNTNYWKGEKYLGLGPSAHSFDQASRQWNIASVQQYVAKIETGEIPAEKEVLTPEQRYNEYMMLGLRTMWGVELTKLEKLAGKGGLDHFLKHIGQFQQKGFVQEKEGQFILTKAGKAFADGIAGDLFL